MAATRSPACWKGIEAQLHRSAYRGGRIPGPRIDKAFHLLSWHAEPLRLAEKPGEIVASGRMILESAITIPPSAQAWLEQVLLVLSGFEAQPLVAHLERSFVPLAGERWSQIHPAASDASSPALHKGSGVDGAPGPDPAGAAVINV